MNDLISRQQECSKRGISFEDVVLNTYGGAKHIAFMDGEIYTGKIKRGCSIVDILRIIPRGVEAIECKSIYPEYGLFYKASFRLRYQMERQRENLPDWVLRRVVFEDFGFNEKEKKDITDLCRSILLPEDWDVGIDFLKR